MNLSDSKLNGGSIGTTWVLSAPDGPQVDPINLAIRALLLVTEENRILKRSHLKWLTPAGLIGLSSFTLLPNWVRLLSLKGGISKYIPCCALRRRRNIHNNACHIVIFWYINSLTPPPPHPPTPAPPPQPTTHPPRQALFRRRYFQIHFLEWKRMNSSTKRLWIMFQRI